MFHFGGANVPGAPGNLLAGGPSFDINRRSGALGGRSGEQLKRLYEGGTQQNEQLNKELIERGIMPRGGPKLPLVQNGAFGGAAGNMGGMMIAQINPTYPVGSPNYGQPLQVGGKPMSLSNSEYSWMQKMNELGRTNPDAYQKIKDMMGPYGWNNPPAGFQVPPGI